MARQNTQLESAGAEFLVLGSLLIDGIPTFKSYTNMKGYDLVAVNAEKKLSVRIQVKSRWRTKAEGFIIQSFEFQIFIVGSFAHPSLHTVRIYPYQNFKI